MLPIRFWPAISRLTSGRPSAGLRRELCYRQHHSRPAGGRAGGRADERQVGARGSCVAGSCELEAALLGTGSWERERRDASCDPGMKPLLLHRARHAASALSAARGSGASLSTEYLTQLEPARPRTGTGDAVGTASMAGTARRKRRRIERRRPASLFALLAGPLPPCVADGAMLKPAQSRPDLAAKQLTAP